MRALDSNEIKLTWFLLLIIFFTSCTPLIRIKDELYLEEVITVRDVSKDDLYVHVNTWMVRTFNDRDSVFKFEVKELDETI